MSGNDSDRKKPPQPARERPANPENLPDAESAFVPTSPKKGSEAKKE